MTRIWGITEAYIKYGCTKEQKARFQAKCRSLGLSDAEVLRGLMDEFSNTMEGDDDVLQQDERETVGRG